MYSVDLLELLMYNCFKRGIKMLAYEVLSYNLKKIRKLRHQSQIDFAAECGISTETLSLLERQKGDPKLSTIQKIALYIDCDPADLIREKEWQV